jgi:hypothetical protein
MIGSFTVVVGAPPEEEPKAPEEPEGNVCWGGSSERTVIVEDFTATQCIWCPSQGGVLNRLREELGEENLIVLSHHVWLSDPWYYMPSSDRLASYYDYGGVPTVIFDGGGYYYDPVGDTLWSHGFVGKWTGYGPDRIDYEAEKARTTNLTISLTGNVSSSEGRVRVQLVATDPITESNLKVKFMVYENGLFDPNADENSGLHHRVFNDVVREILSDYSIPDGSFNDGDTLIVDKTFSIQPGWDISNLGIAVFVQSDDAIAWNDGGVQYNHPVLQAAAMEFVHAGVLMVDGNDNDNYAAEFDAYDEILTKMGIQHVNWDTYEPGDSTTDNVRTMPTFTDIEPYSTVIWFTSSDTSSLSPGSRTAIENYLAGPGHLLMEGEEIGNNALMGGWETWLADNLHASFLNDNAGDNQVDGILADPVTNGIANLGFSHSSPDIIAPSGSTEIFVYSASGTNVGGIRADHDSDSRVIYNAFDFFEGTDIKDMDSREETLMESIIDWFNSANAPHTDVLQPDGGEVIAKVTDYEIHWDSFDVEMEEDSIEVAYALDSSAPTWVILATGEPNDGVYLWTTPNVDSTTCRVRICATDSVGNVNCVISDADFTIGAAPVDSEPPSIYAVRLNGRVAEMVNPGDVVTVTAIVDDSLSNIAGANYTIDAVPTGSMGAQDGTFDDRNETVTATIDTSGWAEAIYTICVTDAYDEKSNVNATSSACASLTITLTPIDRDPPEITNVRVNGQPSIIIPVGTAVTLTADVSDIGVGGSLIAGAEFTVNGGPPSPMAAQDAAYDEAFETVVAFIDTTGWPEDVYTVCVYAWDSLMNINSTGDCAQIVISSDFWPPDIYDVFINGAPTQSWDYDIIPPDFFLTATIDDTTTGNNNIGEANYTIGPSNWPGIKMFPVDMVYNDPVEDVQQIVTTPSLPGTYEYCVYAYDDKTNTNWTGSCATLFIVDPHPPEVLNVLVNGSVSTVVPIGTPVTLDATVDDSSFGNSNILGANYTDGAANWASSTPLLAADGTFDGPVEDVTILIDTTGWTLGLHDVCVYGEDIYGNADLAANNCAQMDVITFGPIPPIMMDAQLTGVGLSDVLVTWQASGDDGTGLDNVVEYEVYTSNLYIGPYSLVTTIPATDLPTYQYTCTGCGYGDIDNHYFYVRAFNGIEYSPSPNRAGKFVRHLTAGQHLVSSPLVLSDTSIGSVLQTIQFDKAWTYDAADMTDHWKSYNEMKPYKGDLWDIDHSQAFWVNVLAEDDWVIAGLVPVLTQVQLYAGWNLVSFPSFNNIYTVGQLKLDVGALSVEGYDPSIPYCLTHLNDMDVVTAGKGFWIYVVANTVWDIIQ